MAILDFGGGGGAGGNCSCCASSRRGREQAAADREAEDGDKGGEAAPARPAHGWTSASWRRHHPSSWYNNAINPVRPPTSTGSQAAATGDISSAVLKSSVTFDKT